MENKPQIRLETIIFDKQEATKKILTGTSRFLKNIWHHAASRKKLQDVLNLSSWEKNS